MLFEEIRKDGYVGGYTILCDFIRDWRTQRGQSKTAFVPLKFALGEAFQFDWSEEGLVIGGIYASTPRSIWSTFLNERSATAKPGGLHYH